MPDRASRLSEGPLLMWPTRPAEFKYGDRVRVSNEFITSSEFATLSYKDLARRCIYSMIDQPSVVRVIKSITAREVFQRVPTVTKQRWGGAFWSEGYDIRTVGQHGSEAEIRRYVANQGRAKEYTQLHARQLTLW